MPGLINSCLHKLLYTLEKLKIIEFITAFFAWIQIVASPLVIGSVIGLLVYDKFPTKIGIILGITISASGLVIGIIWATRIWKKRGTVEFMSRVSSNPEFYEKDNEKE